MRKIIATLLLITILFLVGCSKIEDKLDEKIEAGDAAETEVSSDVSEVDTLDADLDISDLDSLESDLDALDW